MEFKGVFCALITPFKNGKIDEDKFRELIEWQIKNGIDGIVPTGTTGESPTLTHDEQKRLIKIACETVGGRVPVIAGTGSNSTEEALDLTRSAKKSGAQGALVITPYYNKPTPEGQYLHFEKIAKEVDIPLVLYNVPSRTGISILPETVARLSKIPNIVAIKEASGSLDQASKILSLCDITILSGEDSVILPILAVGGKGAIAATANVIPGEMTQMVKAFFDGDLDTARKIHNKIYPVCKVMFLETNPIPAKEALGLMGMIKPEWRLPMCPMQDANRKKLKKVLVECGVIKG